MITGKPTKTGLQMFDVYGGGDGYPVSYGNLLRLRGGVSSGCGELLLGWSGSNNGIEHIYYRNNRDMVETWSDWRTVAFTTDNVASASKLATARTIWGQTFDGTGNVDGIIAITSNGNTLRIGSINSSWYHIYGDQGRPFIVNNKFCTSGNHDLGESNYKWHNLYLSGYAYCDGWFQNNVNGCGLYNSAQNARWYANGGCWNTDKPIIPKANNTQSVGTLSYRFNYGYFTNMNVNAIISQSSNLVITATTLKPSGDVLLENGVFAVRNNLAFSTYNTSGTYCALLGIDGSNYAFVGTTEQTAGTIIRGYEWVAVNFNGLNNSITFSKTEGIYSKIGVYSDGYMSCLGIDSTSDARLKEVLRPVRIPLEAMAQAPAVAFRWKSGRGEDIGGLAQYWLGIEPLAVKAGKEGWLTMNYAGLAYVNTVSLAGELLALRDEVARLERRVEQLEQRAA